MLLSRMTALAAAPLSAVDAAQRMTTEVGALTEAVVDLARSVPRQQLAAITVRLGQIQSDVAELPAIARELGALRPVPAQLDALQRSVDELAATVDGAAALLPDPDDSQGLIAKARDALTADGAS